MSALEKFNLKREAIEAVPMKRVKRPDKMPVATYNAEAEALYHSCQEDREELEAYGLDWELVNDLQLRVGALRHAESLWGARKRRSMRNLLEKWEQLRVEALKIMKILLPAYRHAFCNEPVTLGKLKGIARSCSKVEFLSRLGLLIGIGRGNLEELERVGFEVSLIRELDELYAEMSKVHGKKLSEEKRTSEDLIIRNKAYTYLKELVDEIKRVAGAALWNKPDRLDYYHSTYMRLKKAKQARKKESKQESATN